jgi:LAO/AO transport system kinase
MDLVERALTGDRLALARLLTSIENQTEQGLRAIDALYPHTGQAHVVGVTGGTGTGKSTLVNGLARFLREKNRAESERQRIGIVAVDPTSPFTGGAILGDRIRMRDLAGDDGVFIRSMATRGALGGLALRTRPIIQALDAAGYSLILVETVGAGQSEVEIARTAHTTVVVEAPGLGDEVQAIKAGVLEVADILVVNKADLAGADRSATSLRVALRAGGENAQAATGLRWEVPILKTIASDGEGIPELAKAIWEHREYLTAGGGWQARHRVQVETELRLLLQEDLAKRFLVSQPEHRMDEMINKVASRLLSPRQAVRALVLETES